VNQPPLGQTTASGTSTRRLTPVRVAPQFMFAGCALLVLVVLWAVISGFIAPATSGLFKVRGYDVRADDLWIIATSAISAISCALLGCYLVLRRLSLLGDAISHAILPGLAIAFMITGSRDVLPMLGGAMAAGLLTVILSSLLSGRSGGAVLVKEDAAMGVVFTTLFAIGVLLISWVARDVDLDPGCVLYGLVELAPFNTVSMFGIEAPRALVVGFWVLLLNVIFVITCYKELKIISFDPALAAAMGISVAFFHYMLMGAVAATAVASFEAVGSILVVAMLAAPAATAHLLTDRLHTMLWIACTSAVLSCILGYAGAVWLNTSVAGMIATVSLMLFGVAVIASPRHGLIARAVRRWMLATRIALEDVLGVLFRAEESATVPVLSSREVLAAAGGTVPGRLAVYFLVRRGWILRDSTGACTLTTRGREEAKRLVRGHRQWERFLAERLAMDPTKVHAGAHRMEHYLSDELRAELDAAALSSVDPHGKPIP
jgi:manganese/zinc/iron transport system permease protein